MVTLTLHVSRHLLPSATKLRRLCFYTCLSFCSQGGLPQYMLGYHPPEQAPLLDQPHPPRPGTLPQTRYPHSRHFPTPRTRHHPSDKAPPGPGTPQSRHPPGRRLLLRTVRILLECILVRNRFRSLLLF